MTATYFVLYGGTLALHVVLVSYVLVGAGWLAVRGLVRATDDTVAATFRDWLPFAVGAAITAGVAPLLFVQILYQERFYTANLLLSHRWMAVVPVLIVGFYATYLAKSRRAATWAPRWRAAVAGVAALCFVLVAWSWTENHLLSLRDDRWPAMYAEGTMVHVEALIAPRLLLWLAAALPAAATVVGWQVRADQAALARLRALAVTGLALAVGAGGWLWASLDAGATDALTTRGEARLAWVALLAGEVAVAGAWLVLPRLRDATRGRALAVATAGLTVAVLAGVVLREVVRARAFGAVSERALAAGGAPVFFVFLAVNVVVIAWCVRTARRHLASPD